LQIAEAILCIQQICSFVRGRNRWAPSGSAGGGYANASDATEPGLVVKVKIDVEVRTAGVRYLEAKAHANVFTY